MASMRATRVYPLVLSLAAIFFLPGCSSDSAQRTAYETLQNVGQQDCRKSPSADAECPKRESFDDFQRKRKELESK
jgi:uncharacterized protein YgiB involved in biofilm formation